MYTDDKYFLICTEVIIENILFGLIQNMALVFIKKSYKIIDFPPHAIIKHHAMWLMCRWGSKQRQYTDVTPIGKPCV